MNFNNLHVYLTVVIVTLVFTFLSYITPAFITSLQWYIILPLVILLGIPHGATDHLLYKHLIKDKNQRHRNLVFLAGYLGIVAFYALIWYLFAPVALLLFLIISAYHFGQSNLEHINLPGSPIVQSLAYMISGGFVIFMPIIMHYGEAAIIMESMLGAIPISIEVIIDVRYLLAAVLSTLNVLLLSVLLIRQSINLPQFGREILNLTVLLLLFTYTPLILSFIIYFGLWHSLNSTLMQIGKLKQLRKQFNFSDFYYQALPYTLFALLGIVLVFYISGQYDPGISQTGLFFIIISTVTLPHMLLIDRFYKLPS
jgi:Brp/Blh family beta-carotene 15,15'-monooxygenase